MSNDQDLQQPDGLEHPKTSASGDTVAPQNPAPSRLLSQEIEGMRKRWESLYTVGNITKLADITRLLAIVEELQAEKNINFMAAEGWKNMVEELQKANHELKVSYVVQDPWSHVDQIEGLKKENAELKRWVQAKDAAIEMMDDVRRLQIAKFSKFEEQLAAKDEALLVAEDALGFLKIPLSGSEDRDRYECKKINQAIIKVRSALALGTSQTTSNASNTKETTWGCGHTAFGACGQCLGRVTNERNDLLRKTEELEEKLAQAIVYMETENPGNTFRLMCLNFCKTESQEKPK